MSFEGMTSGGVQRTIKVWFANGAGAGFSKEVAVAEGTNISNLFQSEMGSHTAPEGYVTVVRRGTQVYGGSSQTPGGNQFPLPADFALQDGDRVSVVPAQMKGA